MEVSGRKPHKQGSDTHEGSSDEPQICAGCLEETDVAVEADGFCATCNEFLCAHCYSIHRSPRPMKSHKLLDKHHMPDKPFPPDETCPKHNKNLLDHFCCSHNQLACYVCVRTDHKRCEDVDYIPDICDHVKTTTVLERTRDELAKLVKETETISTEIDSNASTVEELKASVISEVKCFQNKLIDHIEKRVEILEKEIQQLTLQDKVKLQHIAVLNDSLKSEIKKVTDELDMNEKYDRKLKLFTSMKNATSRISLLIDRLHQIKDNNRLHQTKDNKTFVQYSFVRDPNLQSILEQPNECFGQIRSVKDNDERINVSAADSYLGKTKGMAKMETNERAPINECNRNAKATLEVRHGVLSSETQEASYDNQRESKGETNNTAVTATMLNEPLQDVGTETKNGQRTDQETSCDNQRESKGENNITAVTETMAHDPLQDVGIRTKKEQHTDKEISCDNESKAKDETNNTTVAETMPHGPLQDIGKRTKKEQHTFENTRRQEIKVPKGGINKDHDQSAVKPRMAEKNETTETANRTTVKWHEEVTGKLLFERKIAARLTSETFRCAITGMTLLPGNRLILVDNLNNTIKLLDTRTDTIISHISVGGFLWNVAAVSRNRLAVTLGGDPGKIQFVSVSGNRLSADGQLRVSPGCRGMACHGTRLYVSYIYNSAQIHMLDLQGRALQTSVRYRPIDVQFSSPEYVAVNSDGNIYISDWCKDTLICLDPRGQVQWRYQDRQLICPRGVVLDKYGIVYVAGSYSNNIHVVSPAGDQLQVWEDDMIQNPHSLVFSDDEERLYVGMWAHNKILVTRCTK